MTKKVILILISIFLLCGCNKETIEVEEKTETKSSIDEHELIQLPKKAAS